MVDNSIKFGSPEYRHNGKTGVDVMGMDLRGNSLTQKVDPKDANSVFPATTDPAKDQKGSTMSRLFPDKGFKVDQPDTASMMRDVNSPVEDLNTVKAEASAERTKITAVKTDFKNHWDQARGIAEKAIGEAAAKRGYSLDDVRATVGAKGDRMGSPVALAASVAADAATTGLGSMATKGLQVTSIGLELGREARKLPINELRAVFEDAHRQLASQAQTRQMSHSTAQTFGQASQPQNGQGPQFQNTTPKDLMKLLQNRPENEPEMQELDMHLDSLNEVDNNHKWVEEHEHDTPTVEKVLSAMERGDAAAVAKMMPDKKADLVVAGAPVREVLTDVITKAESRDFINNPIGGKIGYDNQVTSQTAGDVSMREAQEVFAKMEIKVPEFLRNPNYDPSALGARMG